MFDGGGLGLFICYGLMPLGVILLFIAAKVVGKIFERRWWP